MATLELGQSLRNDALDTVAGSKNFLHLLTHNAADVNIPIGWFGRWQLENGRIDLKKGGIMPIFSAARVLALKHGIQVRATPERLEAARPLMPDQAEVIDNLIDAHRILLGAILGQQLRDIDRGIPLTNTVAPKGTVGGKAGIAQMGRRAGSRRARHSGHTALTGVMTALEPRPRLTEYAS